MKTFNYQARSLDGAEINGVVEANTQDEAISLLRDQGLMIRKIDETKDSKRDIDLKMGGRKTKEKTLSVVCGQFAILLKAGLPIVRTLQMVAEQTDDKTLKKIFADTADDVAAGYGLASSLEKHGNRLPTTFIESIRAGEESGSLEVVFSRLKEYYEKTSRTKAKVKSAMIYPTFVMVIAVAVVAIIMIFAVPVFKDTFASLGSDLPAITQFVIDSSNFWTAWWWLIAIVIIAIVMGIKLGKKNEAFRLAWSKLAIVLPWGARTPVIGKINLMGAASEYASTMSVMMTAGLPIVRAVEVTSRSMNNYYMSHSLAQTIPGIEAGKTLASCLEQENTLPTLAIEMTAVGEQTGSLESTMEVIGEYFDNEVELATANAMSVLEPCIIVMLAGIVFVLLLSVYLPMFTMYGSM